MTIRAAAGAHHIRQGQSPYREAPALITLPALRLPERSFGTGGMRAVRGRGAGAAGPACRMVVLARHPETRGNKIFSALVTASDDPPPPGSPRIAVTMTVLGDDANECLGPCGEFTLWRGRDVGLGVITRRVYF